MKYSLLSLLIALPYLCLNAGNTDIESVAFPLSGISVHGSAGIPSDSEYSRRDSVSANINLNEIVVHSFKQGNSFKKEAIAATEVSALDIERKNITSIKELGAMIPNLFMPDYGSKLTSPVYIRGIGSKINSPSVGLYVDGIPYFEKCALDFEFDEIDKVEVLRGPQGTLYGRNTMGGIINVYTKSPFAYNGLKVNLGAGNYNNYDGRISYYGKVNDKLGVAVSAGIKHQGGYFTNVYNNTQADSLRSYNYRLRLSYIINDKSDIHFTSAGEYMKQGGYPYGAWDEDKKQAADVSYNSFSSYERKLFNNGLSYIYRAEKFHLNSQTSWQYLSDVQNIDQDFTPVDQYFVIQTQDQHSISEELNIKSAGKGNYKWLFGGFAFYQNSDDLVEMEYRQLNKSTPKYSDSPTYGFALYHQSVIENLFIKNLSLTLGLRYDREFAERDYKAYTKTAEGEKLDDKTKSKLDFSQLSPKIAIKYDYRNSSTYASVTKGYKTGGFNTSFGSDEDRTFKPEYCWEYEIGTKINTPDNKYGISAALFYIDWRNQQIYQPIPSKTGSMLKNAGKSRSQGVEISAFMRPFRNFTLQADYGYTDAKFINYKRNETLDYSDNYLPMVPQQTISASANYRWENFLGLVDYMNFNVNYVEIGRAHV